MSGHKSSHAENDDYMDEKEADSRMISMNRDDDYGERSHPLPQQVIRGMELDLSLAPAKGNEIEDRKPIQETNVLVVFDLPDGSQGESFFKLGASTDLNLWSPVSWTWKAIATTETHISY